MTLKSQIELDITNVFFNMSEFAYKAVYNSSSSNIVDKDILVVIEYEDDLELTSSGQAAEARISLKTSDVPRPSIYDTITIDGIVYTVRETVRRGFGMVTAVCNYDERQNPI